MRNILSKIHNVQFNVRNLGTKANVKLRPITEKGQNLLISCKRPELNHYSSVRYNNFDIVPLASKGWRNSKSKDDFFIVHPLNENLNDNKYSFEEMGLHSDIIQTLKNEGIENATEFQYSASQGFESGIFVFYVSYYIN